MRTVRLRKEELGGVFYTALDDVGTKLILQPRPAIPRLAVNQASSQGCAAVALHRNTKIQSDRESTLENFHVPRWVDDPWLGLRGQGINSASHSSTTAPWKQSLARLATSSVDGEARPLGRQYQQTRLPLQGLASSHGARIC